MSEWTHLMTGVNDFGVFYHCERCDHVTATRTAMWKHRKGPISECDRARVVQWFRGVARYLRGGR